MSCEDHRSPSSALSLLTSLATSTSTSVLALTISPLLAQTPLHFLWRQNVCGLLWEAFHHAVSCKKQTKKNLCLARLTRSWPSHSICHLLLSILVVWVCLVQGTLLRSPGRGPPFSCSLQWFLLPRPLPGRSCHYGRARQVTSSLHVTTWIK